MGHAITYRAVWISDVHLGTRGCKAESLHSFLRSHFAEKLYLVGDIVDAWREGPAWFWNSAQQAVVEEITAWREKGAEVIFLPGNHDEHNPALVERILGPMPSTDSLIHLTAAGVRMLVVHGHQFDGSLNLNRLLPIVGGHARTHRLDDWFHKDEDKAGDFRPITSYLRYPVKKALGFLTDFRDRAITAAARDRQVDGVICGHIHAADYRKIGETLYINDGDWVHSKTAVVEECDGELRVLKWNGGYANVPGFIPAQIEAVQ
jgi:UDP-2,3-diacylglucosamine pyrophosphatase LpxH